MSEMVERVARRLALNAWHRLIARAGPGFMMFEYPNGDEDYVPKRWPEYAESARAAIEAMREPTEAILSACEKMAGNELAWDANADTAATAWRTMIDAALSEQT